MKKLFLGYACLLLYIPCQAGIIYVDDDADPCGDGLSWETAYKYLQDALYNSASNPDVNEIRVARGVYKPDMDEAGNVTSGDREASFQLENGVAIRGGYAGYNGPDPNVWDIRLYETILSGDLDGNDIGGLDDPSRNENAYHVVTGTNTEPNAVLDGFTIIAGKTPGGGSTEDFGAGMYNASGSPKVTNCTFTGNYAGWGGGGMFNSYSSAILTNCVFSENYGGNWGGGIRNDSSSPTLTNCTFIENWASTGGGICSFDSNSALTNCKFIGNSVPSAPLLMYNFNSNESNDIHPMFLWPPGGGMYNHDSSPTVTNCTFSGNSADYGGGMANNGGSPTIANCTYSSNSARLAGGGMWINNSSTKVTNCILWADSAPAGAELSLSMGSTLTVSYSDVQGGAAGVYVVSDSTLNWGTGNITTDPLFVNSDGPDGNASTEDDNLRLLADSPCIDAGDPNYIAGYNETDLDGHPRIIDGDCNDVNVVDMGVYEFNYAYMGDLDYSCSVDFFDFSIFGQAWMTKEGDLSWDWACDINNPPDDYINWRDAAILCGNWLAGVEP
jgi:hypothetical protein